jgi:hypothetical protein
MKQLIFPLVLFAACCGCSVGSKSAQSTQSSAQTSVDTPLSVATTSLPGAVEGVEYSATLAAQGGTPPYTWGIASGQLPAGLTLASTGVISGTPTGPGKFNITVQVTDSGAPPAMAQLRAIAK